jgi:hypothetical protein
MCSNLANFTLIVEKVVSSEKDVTYRGIVGLAESEGQQYEDKKRL